MSTGDTSQGAAEDATSVDHVLLTRFNLPSTGAESYVRAQENWLHERIALFERYCLPSVQRQTAPQRLSWIVYLDPRSPDWLRRRMEEYAAVSPLRPFYRATVPRAQLLADLEVVTDGPEGRGDVLVTTNLDNDDGLAADFSARVRATVVHSGEDSVRAVYVDDGLVLGHGRTYLRRDASNAFCSVISPWSAPVTCWSARHNELESHMPAVHLGGAPGWLQVVHGRNVSNRVKGRMVSPRGYLGLFPGLLDDVPDPSSASVAADLLLRSPGRALRESGRAAAKRGLLAVGGRASLERAHANWNAMRFRVRRQLR